MNFVALTTLNSMFGKTLSVLTTTVLAGLLWPLFACVAAMPVLPTFSFVETKISKKSALAVHNTLEIININPQASPGFALARTCPRVNKLFTV